MGRVEREYIVDEINKRVKENKNLFISNFTNIKAEKLNELRTKLAESSSCYFVVKNTLCRLALEKANAKELTKFIKGPIGFVFCGSDPISISKLLVDFSKGAEGFSVTGGYIDGELLHQEEVKQLALLPSHEQMFSIFTYTIKSPVTSFVGLLGQLIRGLVVVVDQIAKKKEEDSVEAK